MRCQCVSRFFPFLSSGRAAGPLPKRIESLLFQPVSPGSCALLRAVPMGSRLFFLLFDVKGAAAVMIPCQSHCLAYHEGCHKTCAHWKVLQAQNRIERQRKKAYLDYYGKRCDAVARQCRVTRPYYSSR